MARLKTILEQLQCEFSSDEFEAKLDSYFDENYPEFTEDELLCRPPLAMEFCREIRTHFDNPEIPEEVICKTLQKLRKKGPANKERGRSTRISLKRALEGAGTRLTSEQFRMMVVDSFNQSYPEWSADKLICNPTEAGQYCESIRQSVPRLEDHVILRTLINVRKNVNIRPR